MNRWMTRIRSVAAPAVLLALATLPARAAEFFGPLPYLSQADTPAGFASGPMALEDFEDGQMDPRLSSVGAATLIGPGGNTDSVDADDGTIDGSGTQGRSLFGSNLRIAFASPFPRSVGMVWTDGAQDRLVFEAFGPDGLSLGSVDVPLIGDLSIVGTTAEDRFFGVRDPGGIASIRFVSQSTNTLMEIDHVQFDATVEPALFSTLEDGNRGVLMPSPDGALPTPAQVDLQLPSGARPHGLAWLGREALLMDFAQPLLHRIDPSSPGTPVALALTGRSSGNGTLAVDPDNRYALSVGESSGPNPVGEAVVVDFAMDPPAVSPIAGGLRVLGFVTAAIDFAPDGRAFVCHTAGVSVLRPPYTAVDFTMPFPPLQQSPSMCRLSRDGQRLFVTRVLSENTAAPNGVHTTTAPFSAASVFTTMPAPADVQGLGPMAVSSDGQALLLGQQFLFPPALSGVRARAFVLRAPFDGQTAYEEIALPASVSGAGCSDGGSAIQCPGFEHIELSADGSLAVLTGNSSAEAGGTGDRAPAVFLLGPFDSAGRSAQPVLIGAAPNQGRGAGAVRFLPMALFADGLETP
jgi:hypothetical protein